MDEVTGWLFDVYSHTESGVVLWVIADSGERLQLRMELPLIMYLAGDFKLLRAAWVFLKGRAGLARVRRRDLFMGERDVLQVTFANHGDLIQELQNQFPSLDYYDADIPISLRFIALTGVHLLGRCRIRLDRERIQAIEPLDSPWELSPEPMPLRVMELSPDVDPAFRAPSRLKVRVERGEAFIQMEPQRALDRKSVV